MKPLRFYISLIFLRRYPGDPQKVYSSLGPNAKKQLSQRSGFDEQAIDALYDQFTCIANVPWAAGDPAKVQLAIDRRAFNQALTSERWPQRYAPNAVYDRMFAFYDEDNNGEARCCKLLARRVLTPCPLQA